MISRGVLPLEALIAKIDCEFQEAVWTQKFVKGRTFLKGWQGQYTVTLKSNEIGSTKALSNTIPFVLSKTVTGNASVGAGVTTTANRTALMKFSLAFDSVVKKPICAKAETSSLHPFITGRIGFEEWMDRAFDAAESGGRMQIGEPQRVSSLGHSFEFSIDANANAGAGFVIGPAPTSSVNPSATIDRLDDGVVDVAIAKPAVDPLPELIMALTKEERELIAELKKLIDEKQGEINKRTALLNSPENRALLSTMDRMRDKFVLQGVRPSDENQQRETGLNREQLTKLQGLNTLREDNQAAERDIAEARKKIAETKPQAQIVTRNRVLPPERNPEISFTSQQLTLERLNNNLRIVP
jgi:hypothetical protein